MVAMAIRRASIGLGVSLLAAGCLTFAPPAGATTSSPAGVASSSRQVAVIVRAAGSVGAAEAAVDAVGGTVGEELSLIDGFAAQVPAGSVSALRSDNAVASVTPDAGLTFSGTTPPPSPPYSASNDAGSLFNVDRSIGVDQLWNQHASGQGVGVALIDSGVTSVAGIDGNALVNGPDLSLDANTPSLRNLDSYGHGTHLAGIIAGRDSTARNYGAYNNPAFFTGVAPDSTLVNVKVGAADGSVDVSQVIAALDWVVTHRNDPGLNIRVVNLSFGTDSSQSYLLDPLAYAAEAAWHAGIVVVTAAGNEGQTSATLTDPAMDPYVIAVGADGHYDKDGNKLYISSFSSAGDPGRSPDVVAPGQSIASLRDPGSFADSQFPTARTNDPGNRFFRGSGTSQSAAVVSGVVADLLSRYPSLTPDQVKGLLRQNAHPLVGVSSNVQGAGEIDVSKLGGLNPKTIPAYGQTWPTATGFGSLEAARGGAHLIGSDGTILSGETTVFGTAFDGHSWTTNAWDAASWADGSWTGHSWTNDAWDGHSWTTDNWAGHSWTDNTWDGHSWTGHSWTGHSWTDATWTGHSWTDTIWG